MAVLDQAIHKKRKDTRRRGGRGGEPCSAFSASPRDKLVGAHSLVPWAKGGHDVLDISRRPFGRRPETGYGLRSHPDRAKR